MYMCFNYLPEEARELDSVYFLRTTDGMVPLPNTMDEANNVLPGLFEIGILNGHSLVMLQQVINKVCYVTNFSIHRIIVSLILEILFQ